MSFGVNNNINQYPYNQQQQEKFGMQQPQTQAVAQNPTQQDNFNGTVDMQKVGADAKEAAQQSWFGRVLQGFGIKDPKKAAISFVGAIGVVFGLSAMMNKAVKSGSMFELGKKIDNFVQNNKTIKKISKTLSDKIGKPFKRFSKKSNIGKNISELKSHIIKPKSSLVKPMLNGTKNEALDTCTDTLKKFLESSDLKQSKIRKLLFKPDGKEIANALSNVNDAETWAKLSQATDTSSRFTRIFSKDRGPAEIIDSINNLLQKGDSERLSRVNDILFKRSKSEIADAIKKTTDPKVLDELRQLSGKTDVKDIIEAVKDTVDNKQLKAMYSKLTGSEDGFSDFISSIRKIMGNEESKYEIFTEFYEQIRKNFTNGKKLDIDALDKAFAEISKDPAYSTKIKGWAEKSDIGSALRKYAILKGDAADTQIAQKTQQILLRGIEGMSNGVTSRNTMGLLMGLSIYYGVMNKTQDAPKGEKKATFAEEAVGDMGNYMLLPVAASLLYGGATLKYFGSKSSQIAKYKDGVKDLMQKAAQGLSKADVKTQYKALQKGLNRNVKWYQKPIRAIGNILSTGLEVKPTNGKLVKKIKGFCGGAMRFGLVMFALSPMLIKPIMKACHKVFGKPTNTNYPDKQDKIKQKQEEAAKQQQEMMQQIQNMTPQQQYQMLAQLAQLPEIANNPQQKAYIDQMLATLQVQMQQQPLPPQTPGQTAPNTVLPQTPQSGTPTQIPASNTPVIAPAASQPLAPNTNNVDKPHSYMPSDEPAPELVRKDIPAM